LKLRKACSARGAEMGRPSFLPQAPETPLRLKVWEMILDEGGYDQGGAYWGIRSPGWKIFWAESVEETDLGRWDRPPVGTVEMTCDAESMAEAWLKFVKRCPGATLCPVKWVPRCERRLLESIGKAGWIKAAPKGKQFGRSWPFVVPGFRYREGRAFPLKGKGYIRVFRLVPASDKSGDLFVVQEKIYDES
jgi:hypothetical protein